MHSILEHLDPLRLRGSSIVKWNQAFDEMGVLDTRPVVLVLGEFQIVAQEYVKGLRSPNREQLTASSPLWRLETLRDSIVVCIRLCVSTSCCFDVLRGMRGIYVKGRRP
jgi:hypothetical protein